MTAEQNDKWESENEIVNPMIAPSMGEVVASRLTRRKLLMSGASVAAVAAGLGAFARLANAQGVQNSQNSMTTGKSTLDFAEVAHGLDEHHHVAQGYDAQILLRWGDPILSAAPDFKPAAQSAAAQSKQFGFNNDFVGFMPLPRGSNSSDHGLLCVNHEYTTASMMFAGVTDSPPPGALNPIPAGAAPVTVYPTTYPPLTREQVEVEMAAHGLSVVEIKRDNGKWQVMRKSRFNRRITALETKMKLSGPAAGHERMRTSADPEGRHVIGTINNCAGGKTPWGTVLSGEENFHKYFGGLGNLEAERGFLSRYAISGKPDYAWYQYHPRFDVAKEPNESSRFGWVVEIDPYDPQSMPIKRTALGRFSHEGATIAISHDGRAVCYMGDDQRFEYVYKFVSEGRFDANNPQAAKDILDSGILYVARFDEDGSLAWLPLVFGQGPLVPERGFKSQADILIDTRRAADLLGATPMDRPEDVEPNPVTGSVFAVLTNNNKRGMAEPANPRVENLYGHILEMIPPRAADGRPDHTATNGRWEIFLLAGDPRQPSDKAHYHPGVSADGWLTCPDNLVCDPQGRLWIATDGMDGVGIADGIYGADTAGEGRALTRHFFACPRGAEACGPEFTPDGSTLFVAVQHPGNDANSTFDRPSTRWPDFDPALPPRPSVVAITRR